MTYFIEIKETKESKPLVEHLCTLKYVKMKRESDKPTKKYHFTNEEMALPLKRKPNKEELNEFLDRKQGKGADVETVRKRVLAKLAANRK